MSDTSPRRPKIGVVGFIGWGNFGDELFLEVHRQHLGPHGEVVVLHDLLEKPYFSGDVAAAVDSVDAIVIGGGDLIIPWQLSDLYWKREFLEKPVFLVGMGVPRWGGYRDDVIAHMRDFVQHENVKLISTRDEPSREWIRSHLQPRVEVDTAPDIVCALDLAPPAPPAGDRPVLGVVTRYRRGGHDDYLWLQRLCERAAVAGYDVHQLVLGLGQVGRQDAEVEPAFAFPGKRVIRSDDLRVLCAEIGRCTSMASMKFHGSVVAAMYGVPSIVLSATDKNRNFMAMIERPELLSGLHDPTLPDRWSPYLPPIPSHTRAWLRDGATTAMQRLAEAVRAEVGAAGAAS